MDTSDVNHWEALKRWVRGVQFQLHSVLVFDEHLQGIPICWAITQLNDADTMAKWMGALDQLAQQAAGHDAWRPTSFIIDACAAEINAIRCALLNAAMHVCACLTSWKF